MTHREAMRRYFGRSRTVAANWRARELAALRSIEHRRSDPSSFMRFVFLGIAQEARQRAREAGWHLP
jgi:hypothetical protein